MSGEIINITRATQVGQYRIHLQFDDGTHQEIDFGPFLNRAQHPDIRAYLDEALFKTYRLEHGELIWGDYDLCFPIIDLYQNQIEHQDTHKAVA